MWRSAAAAKSKMFIWASMVMQAALVLILKTITCGEGGMVTFNREEDFLRGRRFS